MIKTIGSVIADYLKRSNKLFWLLTIIASCIGCLLIASQQRNSETDFLKTQIIAVLLGYTAAVAISSIDYHYWSRLWWVIGGLGLLLTAAVFLFGIQIAGTDDVGWIRLPFGMTFQPSELTKICFILTFSQHLAWLDEKHRLKKCWGVCTLLFHAALPVVLIHCQGDDGAALVFGFIALIMAFAAGVPLRYFIILFLLTAAAVPVLWFKLMNEDQKNRLLVLFGSDDSMLKTYGWQQYQGKVSIASGGLFGKGYLNGPRVADNVVPYQENDFIFTVAGEEWGFIGCTAILVLFVLLLLRVLMISARAADPFGRNICIGFFSLVGTQTLINLGMVLGLFPVIGITFPFLSAGGTSAACLYLGVGLVQSVCLHPSEPSDRPVYCWRALPSKPPTRGSAPGPRWGKPFSSEKKVSPKPPSKNR